MLNEPHWLSLEALITINRITVAKTNEPHALINPSGLEIARDAPYNRFIYGETNTLRLAVNFLFSIARNHAFEQGNKRTGFIGALVFLQINGYKLTFPDSVDLGVHIIEVLERKLTEEEFLGILMPYIDAR